MADRWIGLCKRDCEQQVRAVVRRLDPSATVTFASGPDEARSVIQDSPYCLGAVVGPAEGSTSSLNVAAAIVKDDKAADVVLVVENVNSQVVSGARRAGVESVMDIASVGIPSLADLDEPLLSEDDVPTMVMGASSSEGGFASDVPGMGAWERDAGAPCVVDLIDDEEEPKTQILSFPAYAANLRRHATTDSDRLNDHALAVQGRRDDRQAIFPETVVESVSLENDGDMAPILTFVSGRGGVGKTSVVAIMAAIAASWHMRVALCDLDLTCGNLHSFFGKGVEADLGRLVESQPLTERDIASFGCEVLDGVRLWGPCKMPETAELVYPHAGELLTALSYRADLVLVDTSTTFTDAVAQAAQQCDRLVITVDERPGAQTAQARLASLAVRLGVARTRVVRLANRCSQHGKSEPHINRTQMGLEAARPMRVLDGGMDVSDCFAEGRVDELMSLGSKFVESAATALAKLLNELGSLPAEEAAQHALQATWERSRWSFGRRREAM